MQKGAKRVRPAEAGATSGERLAADVCCENFGLASGFARQPIASCDTNAKQSPIVSGVKIRVVHNSFILLHFRLTRCWWLLVLGIE